MKKKGLPLVFLLAITLLVSGTALAEGLSGNEILARIEEKGGFFGEGSFTSMIRLEQQHADGTTGTDLFFGLAKQVEGGPEYLLIYFLEPASVAGFRLLFVRSTPDEDARMWQYLPALGMVMEIVVEAKEQRFAGSTLSYEEIGGRGMVYGYDAELIGQETIAVGDQLRPVYVLALTAEPDTDVDHPTMKIWVDKEGFIVLRSESYDGTGTLVRMMEVLKLGEFEGNIIADRMISADLLDGSSTTITFLDRRRPAEEIPDSVFAPENLADFDLEAHRS